MKKNTNNPPITIELTDKLANFLLENCATNMAFGLSALQKLASRDLQERMVEQIENFKAVKTLIEKAKEE